MLRSIVREQMDMLDHDDVQAALWQLARRNCFIDGKKKERARKTRRLYCRNHDLRMVGY